MKISKIHPIINTAIILAVLIVVFLNNKNNQMHHEVIYVNSDKLLNEFALVKDLKAAEEIRVRPLIMELDSLNSQLNNSQLKTSEDIRKRIEGQYNTKRMNLQRQQEVFLRELNVKVWRRLNSYFKDYEKVKGFKIVVGSSSNTNVLYASDLSDLTDDFLQYSNTKYEKGE